MFQGVLFFAHEVKKIHDLGIQIGIVIGGGNIYRGLNAGKQGIDRVTGEEAVTYKGEVPERSVVIPGSYTKKFKAGEYNVSCALIIGKRKESTNLKTSLNDALRDYQVAV